MWGLVVFRKGSKSARAAMCAKHSISTGSVEKGAGRHTAQGIKVAHIHQVQSLYGSEAPQTGSTFSLNLINQRWTHTLCSPNLHDMYVKER